MGIKKQYLASILLILSIPLLSCTKNSQDIIDPGNDDTLRGEGRQGSGLLFYGKANYATDISVISNPYITGGFFQIIWSEIEKANGVYDWTEVDKWIDPWKKAGKSVALRIMWSTSGYWPQEYYKHPTPQWVWQEGAKFAYHNPSQTEIPLIWDPVYKKFAFRFLREAARRFDKDTSVLFLDITPGAETNPYRFGTIDESDPAFRDEFLSTVSSDGKAFNQTLWVGIVREFIDTSKITFKDLPLLVTLNNGNMPTGPSNLVANGNYCAAKRLIVGQNGLKGSTPVNNFEVWSHSTKVFFEMWAKSGGAEGTLMEVMMAAKGNNASFLNVYPEDVRKGTKGLPEFDPLFEEALKYGDSVLTKN